MDWQQLLALLIVVCTAGVFLRSSLRKKKKFSFEKDTHCGCASDSQIGPAQSIQFKARKGERPRVIVRNQ